MTKLLNMTNELYETRNMVNFLKRKLQVDSKQPILISDALSSVKVSLSLHKRLTQFLSDNTNLQVYSKRVRVNMSDLNEFLTGLSQKYSEESEFNLSDKQKNFIVENVKDIEYAVLNMAGRIYYSLVEINGLSSLSSEQRDFLDEAEKIFSKDEEKSLETLNKMEEAESKGLDISDLEDEEDDFVLGSGTVDTTQPRKIISEDIDK